MIGESGYDCSSNGNTLDSIPILAGFWRSGPSSLVIHRYLEEEACRGGTFIESSDDYCADGYKGPYCSVCQNGFRKSLGNTCFECNRSLSIVIMILGILFLVFLGIIFAMTVIYLLNGKDRTSTKSLRRIVPMISEPKVSSDGRFWCSLKRFLCSATFNRLKNLIVVWQILVIFRDIVRVPYPTYYNDL